MITRAQSPASAASRRGDSDQCEADPTIPAKAGRKGRLVQNWCFTLNNYTDEEIEVFKKAARDCSYAIIGKEVGESRTPHLQGFFNFGRGEKAEKRQRLVG